MDSIPSIKLTYRQGVRFHLTLVDLQDVDLLEGRSSMSSPLQAHRRVYSSPSVALPRIISTTVKMLRSTLPGSMEWDFQ